MALRNSMTALSQSIGSIHNLCHVIYLSDHATLWSLTKAGLDIRGESISKETASPFFLLMALEILK